MKITRPSIVAASSLLVGGFMGASALVALADSTWTPAPSCTTVPCNNVSAPITAGGAGDPLTYSQIKTGILGLNNLVVKNIQVLTSAGTTSATQGQVLTAIDSNGNLGWRAAATGGGGGSTGIVFVMPSTLLTVPDNTAINWVTVADLRSKGVPSNASAVILGTEIHAGNSTSYTHMYMRPSATVGATMSLAEVQTSGGGAPSLSNFNQSIYPVAMNNGAVTIDVKTDGNLSGSSVTLVGYIGTPAEEINTGTLACTAVSAAPDQGGNVKTTITRTGTPTGGNGTSYVYTLNYKTRQRDGFGQWQVTSHSVNFPANTTTYTVYSSYYNGQGNATIAASDSYAGDGNPSVTCQ